MFAGALSQPIPDAPSAFPHAAADDRELVQATLAGSQAAFERLIERHQARVFRLLQRFVREPAETEDLAQEVFLKVYRRLHTFHFDAAFYTWLYRIAVNTATDHVQRKRRSPVQAVEDLGSYERPGSGPELPDRELMRRELGEVARAVLARMPEKFRTILVLREYEGCSYEEIAKTLGCALGTVESRLFRAREKFRAILEKLFPEYGGGSAGKEGRA